MKTICQEHSVSYRNKDQGNILCFNSAPFLPPMKEDQIYGLVHASFLLSYISSMIFHARWNHNIQTKQTPHQVPAGSQGNLFQGSQQCGREILLEGMLMVSATPWIGIRLAYIYKFSLYTSTSYGMCSNYLTCPLIKDWWRQKAFLSN